MPDWTYEPLLKPITAWLPAPARRSLALRSLGALAATPAGPWLIEFLGRMKPDASLEVTALGRKFLSPVGIGSSVDPEGVAIGALGRFGVGFVELEPSTLENPLQRRIRRRPQGLAVFLRFVVTEDDREALLRLERLLEGLDELDAVCVSVRRRDGHVVPGSAALWRALSTMVRQHSLSAVLVDLPMDEPVALAAVAMEAGASGVVLRAPSVADRAIEPQDVIRNLRQSVPAPALLVAGCGAASPREIADQLRAGADLVGIDRGLVETGPGLAKRGNEALACERCPDTVGTEQPLLLAGWTWMLLLGLGLFVSGAVVWWVGLTQVVLPYDLAFLGISRPAFIAINPRLLLFMRHDRLTLAATMLSIGVLYASLAWNGMRGGWLWSRHALISSAVVGFASLFLFLGFHYVDPLHVALTAALFPLFVLGIFLPTRQRRHRSADLDNDSAWRLGLAGQLFFVGLGFGLTVAGLTISAVGIIHVFVFSDLQFLGTTAAILSSANAHLLPLIAHDRAGFGGILACDGVGVLLVSLWGFRRGERWVWWTLLAAGLVGLLGGLYAHVVVGYLEFGHLFPLFVSAVVFAAGLGFSARFLLSR